MHIQPSCVAWCFADGGTGRRTPTGFDRHADAFGGPAWTALLPFCLLPNARTPWWPMHMWSFGALVADISPFGVQSGLFLQGSSHPGGASELSFSLVNQEKRGGPPPFPWAPEYQVVVVLHWGEGVRPPPRGGGGPDHPHPSPPSDWGWGFSALCARTSFGVLKKRPKNRIFVHFF